MEVIAKTAFGLNIDSQKDKNNIFVKMAKQGLRLSVFNPFMLITCKYIFHNSRLIRRKKIYWTQIANFIQFV